MQESNDDVKDGSETVKEEAVTLREELRLAQLDRKNVLARQVAKWMRLVRTIHISYGFYPHEVAGASELKLENRQESGQTRHFRIRRITDCIILSHLCLDPNPGYAKQSLTYAFHKTINPPAHGSTDRTPACNTAELTHFWNEVYEIMIEEDQFPDSSIIHLTPQLHRAQY